MKKYFFFILACICVISGCGKPGDIRKIYSGRSSFEHVLFDEKYCLSFIKDALPNKTYLSLVDAEVKGFKKYYFRHCGLLGLHEFVPAFNQAVCDAVSFRNGVAVEEMLVLDLADKSIAERFLLPEGYTPVLIRKPAWADVVYVLMYSDKSKACVLKALDLKYNSFSDSKMIGIFQVENAFFMERAPFLILDVVIGEERELIIYNIIQGAVVQRYPLESPFIELREGSRKDVVYGLFQVPGDLKSMVYEFALRDNRVSTVVEIDGELESMLVNKNVFYMIGKDHKRRDKQGKYWLYPRSLYIVDRGRSSSVDIVEWTDRQGEFIGLNPEHGFIFYAVTDNDAPGIWAIKGHEALRDVRRFIR